MLRLAAAGSLGRSRSLRVDAAVALRSAPTIRVEGREHVPAAGPFLLAVNHYNPPGIGIWWQVMALSAALPADPHWVMTAAWTYSGWLARHTLSPITAWAFARVAQVYGFTNMPVMPPRPHEAAARVAAVRKVIAYARAHPEGVVALAPEGHNTPDLSLGWPPSGSGRFMMALAERLGQVLPAGIYAEQGQLVVRFGPPFTLSLPAAASRADLDRLVARQVMQTIAALVPIEMRGEFGG